MHITLEIGQTLANVIFVLAAATFVFFTLFRGQK